MIRKNTKIQDMTKGGTLVIYAGTKGGVELRADANQETIWATQDQIAELFDGSKQTISRHMIRIFNEGELREGSVVKEYLTTGPDNKVYSRKFYNLDAIIAVGYRVNSKNATKFRIWATKTLREYLIKGIVYNADRIKKLPDKILFDLEQKIGFIQRTLQNRELNKSESDSLLSVIHDYAHSWTYLKEYDEGTLALRRSKNKEKQHFDYEFVRPTIDKIKLELIEKSEASELFASERDGSFQGILKTIYQTYGGKELYSSLEEKAAHLLYFTIKDHPFSDGNKRVGAFLFVLFLQLNGILNRTNGERKINDNTLVALALLIAESNPKEKDVMVALTTNLLA